MAIRVKCPGCGASIEIPGQLAGRKAECTDCRSVFMVPIPEAVIERPEPAFTLPLPHAHHVTRRRKSSPLGMLAKIVAQAAITGGTLYAGYLIISKRIEPRAPQRPTPAPLVNQLVRQPQRLPNKLQPRPIVIPSPRPAKDIVPKPAVVQNPIEARPLILDKLPTSVGLPAVDDRQIATLTSVPDGVTISLATNCRDLVLEEEALKFSEDGGPATTVAGPRLTEGRIEFRWADSPSKDAERHLRNSLLVVRTDEERKTIALRMPRRITAEPLELDKGILRVSNSGEWQPDPETVRVDFTAAAHMPEHSHHGDDLLGMAIGKKARLQYFAESATEVRIEKLGKAVLLILETRYELPSGDVQQMSQRSGNRHLNRLEDLAADAAAAPNALADLRRQHTALTTEYSHVSRTPTWRLTPDGSRYPDPVLAAKKSVTMANLEKTIARVANKIEFQDSLVRDTPAIQRDLEAIRKVASISKSLKSSKISYRFYVAVGDDSVDLIIAE